MLYTSKISCQMQNSVTHSMVTILLILLLVSLTISSIAGSIISKSITDPIKQLSGTGKKTCGRWYETHFKNQIQKMKLPTLQTRLSILLTQESSPPTKQKAKKLRLKPLLFQNMNDGIIAFDLKGNLIHFNREAKKLLNRQYLDDVRFDRFF